MYMKNRHTIHCLHPHIFIILFIHLYFLIHVCDIKYREILCLYFFFIFCCSHWQVQHDKWFLCTHLCICMQYICIQYNRLPMYLAPIFFFTKRGASRASSIFSYNFFFFPVVVLSRNNKNCPMEFKHMVHFNNNEFLSVYISIRNNKYKINNEE